MANLVHGSSRSSPRADYTTQSWSQDISATTTKQAFFPAKTTTPVQTTTPPVTLTLYVRDGSASGPTISGVYVNGNDYEGKSFSQQTNSNGYVTLSGKPGTWQFTITKSGYTTQSWSQDISATTTKQAFFPAKTTTPVQTTTPPVTLTLYVHDGSASGPLISGVAVTGIDADGKSFSQQTNSNGYVTLSGKPGTWQFTITKSGYTTQSWSQDISATTTKQAFFPAKTTTPVQTTTPPVTLTLYVRDGSASGPTISGVYVNGNDYEGKSFSQQTNSNGYVTLSGKPGTWQFTITKSGYTTQSWSQDISATTTKQAFFPAKTTTPVQTTTPPVTLTLYVHDGSASGPLISGVAVTGIDADGKSFSQQTNSNGYVTLSGKPGTWQFTITKSGYTTQSWSQDISATTTKQAFFPAKTTTPVQTTTPPVTLTLYVRDGSASGPTISGVYVNGNDYEGKSFSQQTNSNGYVTLSGKPGTWQFTITKSGYTTQSWSQDISATTTKQAFFPAKTTTPVLTSTVSKNVAAMETISGYSPERTAADQAIVEFKVEKGGVSGPIMISNAQVFVQDGSGKNIQGKTNNDGITVLTGEPGTWQWAIFAPGYMDQKGYITASKASSSSNHVFLQEGAGSQPLNDGSTLFTPLPNRIMVKFEIVPGAQLKGTDGKGDSFLSTAYDQGFVVVTGSPGKWQWTGSAPGYLSNSWSYEFLEDSFMALSIEKDTSQPTLDQESKTTVESFEASIETSEDAPKDFCISSGYDYQDGACISKDDKSCNAVSLMQGDCSLESSQESSAAVSAQMTLPTEQVQPAPEQEYKSENEPTAASTETPEETAKNFCISNGYDYQDGACISKDGKSCNAVSLMQGDCSLESSQEPSSAVSEQMTLPTEQVQPAPEQEYKSENEPTAASTETPEETAKNFCISNGYDYQDGACISKDGKSCNAVSLMQGDWEV